MNFKRLEILLHFERKLSHYTHSEVERLRILDVQPQCRFAGGEVTVQLLAIVHKLITLERHYGIHFAGARILHSSLATVRYHRVGNVVLHVAICQLQE